MALPIAPPGSTAETVVAPSLFERSAWAYTLLREHLFRDDTEVIVTAIWPDHRPGAEFVLELGCGPGFYCRRLARRYPALQVVGVDRSARLVERAQRRAARERLDNCRFNHADALALPWRSGSVDVVIASRLFTVIEDPHRLMSEMYRVLRSGGRCFVAEPRPHPLANLPLYLLWSAVGLADLLDRHAPIYREPRSPRLLDPPAFDALIESQPWAQVRRWSDGRYYYAICSKPDNQGRG